MNNIKGRISQAVNQWNDIRWNLEAMKELFDKGSYFAIPRSYRTQWLANNPGAVHAYPGIEDGKIIFVLIDSETDKTKLSDLTDEQLEMVKIVPFTENFDINGQDFIGDQVDGNISVLEAAQRSLRWSVYKESWLKDTIENTGENQGVFRVFSIPFESVRDRDSIVILGLKPNTTLDVVKSRFLADALVWSANSEEPAPEVKAAPKAMAAPEMRSMSFTPKGSLNDGTGGSSDGGDDNNGGDTPGGGFGDGDPVDDTVYPGPPYNQAGGIIIGG